MPTSTYRRAVALVATSGALLLALLAIAPQSDATTLYACVKKKSGTVRLVSKRTKCKKTESKASWGSAGPAGKDGARGVQGAPGPGGVPGTTGHVGELGPQGPGAETIGLSAKAGITDSETVGLAKFKLKCTAGSNLALEITEPEELTYSFLLGTEGKVFQGDTSSLPFEVTLSGLGEQFALSGFLRDRFRVEQFSVDATIGALGCNVLGDAIPLPDLT